MSSLSTPHDPRAAASIRPILTADHAACCRLWGETEGLGDTPDAREFSVLLAVNPGLGRVAEVGDGRMVGAILVTSDGIRGMFYRLAVDRGFRRRGIATALVEAATEGLTIAGVSRINIHVFAWNRTTLAFWAAMGFAPYPDLVTLQRRLRSPAPSLPAGAGDDG